MLNLDSSYFVSKGKHRECYVHPDNKNLLIKILLPSVKGSALTETLREARYYRFLVKKNIPFTMLPAFHGEVITNRGRGYVFDLIRDFDGSISKSLEYYLTHLPFSEREYGLLDASFDLLREYLMRWKILTMHIQARNIVYQKIAPDERRLVIIDDIGNSEFIPVSSYFDFLAQLKIKRKWRRFISSLLHQFPDNEFLKNKFSQTH
ncbi:MAG TPA: YrbL family protein [Smithellaceae bacterium]|nr:YrbL family protein [Smithellaceae bacterium]HRS88977.1 YrbL family protein [Smithellaceae bacterium]HRV25593.1 YrbL family protein [Smithellaceae bacterium]